MGKLVELTGESFGRLVVLERAEDDKWGKPMWLCLCTCGNQAIVLGSHLRAGHTTSCSCYKRERAAETGRERRGRRPIVGRVVHGQISGGVRSPTYVSWQGAVQRTTDANHVVYAQYGAIGVRMCERYRSSVTSIIDDIGERPEGKSLDRVSSEGHYSCGLCTQCEEQGWKPNVQWSTPVEQANNRKNTIVVQAFARRMGLAQWARLLDLPYSTLLGRYKRGWDVHRLLTQGVEESTIARLFGEDCIQDRQSGPHLPAHSVPSEN